MFTLAAALKKGYSVDRLYELTKIDRWFLVKMSNIIKCYTDLESLNVVEQLNVEDQLTSQLLLQAKQMGFSDKQIAGSIGSTELAIRSKREEYGNGLIRTLHSAFSSYDHIFSIKSQVITG